MQGIKHDGVLSLALFQRSRQKARNAGRHAISEICELVHSGAEEFASCRRELDPEVVEVKVAGEARAEGSDRRLGRLSVVSNDDVDEVIDEVLSTLQQAPRREQPRVAPVTRWNEFAQVLQDDLFRHHR